MSNLSNYIIFKKKEYEAFRELKDNIQREIKRVPLGFTNFDIDPFSKKRIYHFEGAEPLKIVNASAYIKENKRWNIPHGVIFPDFFKKLINTKHGAIIFMSGPFYYVNESLKGARIYKYSDDEVYQMFGLKKILNDKGQPLSLPMIGHQGRSLILPLIYKINRDRIGMIVSSKSAGIFSGRYVNRLEFKGVGTSEYREHHVATEGRVIKELLGKPGVFLGLSHQTISKVPVGLATAKSNIDLGHVERKLLQEGAVLNRLYIDGIKLDKRYGVALEIPIGDLRRLENFNPMYRPIRISKRDYAKLCRHKLVNCLTEYYKTRSFEETLKKYLPNLIENFKRNFIAHCNLKLITKPVLDKDMDIFGAITDLGDSYDWKKIKEDPKAIKNARKRYRLNFKNPSSCVEINNTVNWKKILREILNVIGNSHFGDHFIFRNVQAITKPFFNDIFFKDLNAVFKDRPINNK